MLAKHEGSTLPGAHRCLHPTHLGFVNNNSTKLAAHLKSFDLIAKGWGSLSKHFARVMYFLNTYFRSTITYIDAPDVQRHSWAETTVRMVRRVEHVRQGFRSVRSRVAHFKLWQYRRYLRT